MWNEVLAQGKILGHEWQTESALMFFGTRHLETREQLAALYPEYEFVFLKQVHGARVVHADGRDGHEADAHYTRMATRALVVQTADCAPLLLASKNQVCAIHAGWRGAAAKIVAAAAPFFADDPVTDVAIGPHIQKASFEVGHDVAESLRAASPDASADLTSKHNDPGKLYFDLNLLLRLQLRHELNADLRPRLLQRDTFRDELYRSFRRDREKAGRLWSFVVLNQ